MGSGFWRVVCFVCGWASVSALSVSGQVSEVGDSEIPLMSDSRSVDLLNVTEGYRFAGMARRCLGAGLYDLAYSYGVEAEALGGDDAFDFENSLVVIDSLLARTQWVEAKERLAALWEWDGVPRSRVELREAMIEFAESDWPAVVDWLAGVTEDGLDGGDVAWLRFLRGWSALKGDDLDESEALFELAMSAASSVSPALAAQIGSLVFRSELEHGVADASTIPQLQNALLESSGREVRFVYAQQLAALLNDAGEVDSAIELIASSLEQLPEELARERAQFLLLATMAGGLGRVEGRQAFAELMEGNAFPDLMSVALQQTFSAARLGERVGEDVVKARLDQMIGGGVEHLLLDQALYYRAVFRFLGGDYLGAEDDAAELQRRFPNSTYRRGMLALQASSAWNRQRYRTAANRLQAMRSEFVDLGRDYRLSASIADCYFRAGRISRLPQDFGNAADAYETALSNVATGFEAGPLFFQLVFARLRAGQLDEALSVIDDSELRSLAGGEMVWRANWLALKELRAVGRAPEAYERSQEAVLAESEDPLLKLRLLWLTARLSVVSGDPEYTIDWVREIEEYVASDALLGADREVLNKVLASSLLSLSESHFALGEPEEAVALLERLRVEYPGYESALLSYISHARFLSLENRTVEAQQLLVSLADEYKDHRLAPSALLEAALNAVRRGQDTYLDEATKLLQRIATDYPDSEIVFQARLMQADLLRRLNKFGSAERIYFLLENEYADHPDRFLAQMSMADTLLAQSNEDEGKFDGVVSRLELLADLPEAPLDLRVEAGYKLGQAWRSRGEPIRAKRVFWQIYDKMFGGEVSGSERLLIRELGPKGRYWVSRCLFGLAEISLEEGLIDQANSFYETVIMHRLTGVELARVELARRRAELEAPVLEEAAAN